MIFSKKQPAKKFALIIIISLLTWFLLHTAFIVIDGLTDDVTKADVAVVLGNKVEVGGQPSSRLQARLDKAVELHEKGYVDYIIVSGGTGKEGFDEAQVMKHYLEMNGIPDDQIIEDHNGYNSYMTAENAKVIMKKLDLQSVVVISQYFHITRTKLAFKKLGIEEVYSAHAEIFELRDFYSTVREFPAYYKYLFNFIQQ